MKIIYTDGHDDTLKGNVRGNQKIQERMKYT